MDGSRKYVWGAGGLAYETDLAGTVQAVPLVDGLGSVRALTDATGALIQTSRTEPFGVPTQSQGSSTQPFVFTGEQVDPTGLVYLRARMYDPASGRFLQKDPLPKSGPGITGWNRYAYAGDNPMTLVDPSGLSSAQALQDDSHKLCIDVFSQHFCIAPGTICPPIGPCVATASPVKNFDPFGGDGEGDVASSSGTSRQFSSKDPIVGDVANAIEARYAGHVIDTNIDVFDPATGLKRTDFDIETQNAVIQVKTGSARGLGAQLEETEKLTTKTVIGYAPDAPAGALAEWARQGYLVTNDLNTLLAVIAP